MQGYSPHFIKKLIISSYKNQNFNYISDKIMIERKFPEFFKHFIQ